MLNSLYLNANTKYWYKSCILTVPDIIQKPTNCIGREIWNMSQIVHQRVTALMIIFESFLYSVSRCDDAPLLVIFLKMPANGMLQMQKCLHWLCGNDMWVTWNVLFVRIFDLYLTFYSNKKKKRKKRNTFINQLNIKL